jgi:predicted Zn-dependent peptidase
MTSTPLHTLPNGVRLVVLPSASATATVAAFVRSGSAHEDRLTNGVSHFVEHMLFKGTASRDAHRINLDAESLGAQVNAHTDRDHTGFYMRGLPAHANDFARMLGELVGSATFPADELEREREVLLQELAEDEDDPVSTAFELFDAACFGSHPTAQPVIGSRARVEGLKREDLVAHVARQYRGPNVVVGLAAPPLPAKGEDAFLRACEAAFGTLPTGTANIVDVPPYLGGVRTRAQAGSSQTHAVIGGTIQPQRHCGIDDEAATALAAAVLGEGMSSPLLRELREQRAIAYHVSAAADRYDMCGQFVVEASMAPERFDEWLDVVLRLLRSHARHIDDADLARARRQLHVQRLRDHDKPLRRIEQAALDLFVHDALRAHHERLEAIDHVPEAAVRAVFTRMLDAGLSLAMSGSLKRAAGRKARETIEAMASSRT